MSNAAITTSSRTFELSKDIKKGEHNSFWAAVKLYKYEYCEECLGPMKKIDKRWEPARSGPIAGWDIITYTCEKCGHTHEESHSRD